MNGKIFIIKTVMSFFSCYDILPLWRYFMEYYIDLGSSTIKVYCYENELKLIEEHSIYFKNDFDREKGISESNLKELCDYFEEIKERLLEIGAEIRVIRMKPKSVE